MTRERGSASDLRMKYRPRMRMGVGLVSFAPWLDVLLVVALFWASSRVITMAPGMMLDLPEAPFEAGSLVRHVLLVFAARPGGRSGDTAFFQDEQYDLSRADRRAALAVALQHLGGDEGAVLTVFADRGAQHGTVSELLAAARSAGIAHVNLATGIPAHDTGGMHEAQAAP